MLTKKSAYAIEIVRYLRTQTTLTSANDLANYLNTTPLFIEQIMGPLRKSNTVLSQRGPGGGYFINQSIFISEFAVMQLMGQKFKNITNLQSLNDLQHLMTSRII